MAEVTKQDRADAQAIYNAYRKSGVPCKGAEMVAAIREQAREAAEKVERERCAALAEDELVEIYDDTPDEIDKICNATVRNIISGIRGDHRKG